MGMTYRLEIKHLDVLLRASAIVRLLLVSYLPAALGRPNFTWSMLLALRIAMPPVCTHCERAPTSASKNKCLMSKQEGVM